MLSEDAIDNLIQPLIDRQNSINDYIIRLLAKRIQEIGEITPSDVYKLEVLLRTGGDVRKINKKLSELTALQVKDIKRIIMLSAEDSYKATKPYYDYRRLPFIPLKDNIPLQREIEAIQRITVGNYKNISKAQAYMIRDTNNKLVPTPMAKAYQLVIDKAIQATQNGITDYNSAIRQVAKDFIKSGLRYANYQAESGKHHSQRIENAVRRNILDGVRAVNQTVQDITGEQFGADGKEITVHEYPAPDHAPVQGHIFTNEEYEKLQTNKASIDINGQRFAPFQRAIGTLNCRHFTFSIIIGVNKPNYTQEQLNEILERNQKGYTTKDGKHYTMYQCTQVQRRYEREIRIGRENKEFAEISGDDKFLSETKAKLSQDIKEYQLFSKKCGLKPKMDRTL